ncbi:hypothetical protein [Oceanobacillus iheyensis HTE831]|uniref:Cohesin domain-containing protein n=2 Tax=Oceanobacillus iheyensis TaxID=182710 RepID=Q8ESA9_OCEIH|nr:hypothetical protein [Oceanobacillus iheyensis HTE831]
MHNFVKEGTPYSTVSSNKKEITVDEEVEFTLTAHNVEMLQEANFQLNYDKQQLQLVDVKLHEDVESYGDPTITYSEESISNTRNNISISTAINDIEQEVTGDIPIAVATFTGKEADFGRNNYVKNPTLSTTYTNTQEETTNLRGYYEGQNTELLRNYSEVRGNILAQGFFGLDGQYDSSQEFPNASIQMQATDAEGNKYDATIENDNDFTIQVPVTDETFDLEVKIPGSFPSPYNF